MSNDARRLEERLSCHPELQQKIEQLLRVVESTGNDLARADEAERQVIQTLRQMGNDALSAWATRRVEQTAAQSRQDSTLRACGQKNSIGAVPTG